MKYIMYLTICSLTLMNCKLYAQKYVQGIVKDSISLRYLEGSHIRNISKKTGATTNMFGTFTLSSSEGDTLIISHIGYKTTIRIVKKEWLELQKKTEFCMHPSRISLDEIVVTTLPPYEVFKALLLNTSPKDHSFRYYGAPNTKRTILETYDRPAFLRNPISSLYSVFSKREKEKRKMYQINKKKYIVEKANMKFTRQWVSDITKLKGDSLTSFIAYCNFSSEYILKTPEYMIGEEMLVRLKVFLKKDDSINTRKN